jgi:serine/threonine-protein kinase RsbW
MATPPNVRLAMATPPNVRMSMATLPNVCLNLSNRAENVALVRETLTGVAQAVGIDGNDLNDIGTAVTEACNNVVLHAYAGEGQGPLKVEIHLGEEAMEVAVCDRGSGICARIPSVRNCAPGIGVPVTSGIGVPVMQALAQRVELSSEQGVGTKVRMRFATPGAQPLESLPEAELDELPAMAQAELASTAGLVIAPTSLARAVLPRLLCALAARARFSTDRISDAQLVADALVAQTPESIDGGHVAVGVSVTPREMELRIGPLRTSRTSWLVVNRAVAGLGPVVERLTDGRDVVAVGPSEALALQLSDRRDASSRSESDALT